MQAKGLYTMSKKDLIYFPENIEEVESYVETLLAKKFKEDYEAEKLLLHAVIVAMFETHVPEEEFTPQSVMFLLQTSLTPDDTGFSLLDKLFDHAEQVTDNPAIDMYWMIKNTDVYPDVVIRLVSVYQFYDSLFPDIVYSNDQKTLIRYPSHLKDAKYRINDGVEKIAPCAFAKNPYLRSIKIPKTVSDISYTSFSQIPHLKSIVVEEGNEHYSSRQGILFHGKNHSVLMKYPNDHRASLVYIPDSVKTVKKLAFENCQHLVEVSLGSNKINLEDKAFVNCRNIQNLIVSNTEEGKINFNAFDNISLTPPNDVGNHKPNSYPLDADDEHENKTENTARIPMQESHILQYRTPSEITAMLDDYIIGHEQAKKTIAVAVFSHILRCNNGSQGIGKSNILMCGPTGCGKTEFARTIAKCLDVPFVVADATSITETGWKGNDPTDMLKDLLMAAGQDLEKAQRGIIYIDEIDKLASFGENSHRESFTKGTQQGLLRIIEGGVIPLRMESMGGVNTINFDTNNVLFIASGAFSGLTSTQKFEKKTPIGFVDTKKENVSENKKVEPLEAKDFIKYGMTQEFIGRFPVIVQLQQLSENEIYRIMTEPKNSVVSQYQKLVHCIGSELVFEEELLKKIAGNAVKTGAGARGLRTVIEKLVEGTIYELPDKADVKKVVIHEGMLNSEPARYEMSAEN